MQGGSGPHYQTGRKNQWQANGKTERESNFGLNILETPFRGYDPALGRFHQPDAITDLLPGISSYTFAFNNPVYFNDPTGLVGESQAGPAYRKASERPEDPAGWSSRDNFGNITYHGVNAQGAVMSIQGGVNQGGGSNPAANVNATPGGGGRPEPLTVDKLREVAGQNGITDLIRIGEVFEAAFLEATRGQVMPNDKRGPGNNYHVEEYKSSIRTALVRPDGLGRTATREGYGFINLVENSAFYEVKSGNTTLDEFYSRDNPKQLLAMLEVLSRNPAHKFGNATLFLVTPHGVTVNLVERARQYGVNVIQITPSLLEDGSVTFNKAMAHYVVPHGSLGRQIRPVQGNQIIPQAEVNLSFFNKPVPLRWQR